MKRITIITALMFIMTYAYSQKSYKILHLSMDNGATWLKVSGSVISNENTLVIAQDGDDLCVIAIDRDTVRNSPEGVHVAYDCKLIFSNGMQLPGEISFQYSEDKRTVWISFFALGGDSYLIYHVGLNETWNP